jgi:hypothetical protein
MKTTFKKTRFLAVLIFSLFPLFVFGQSLKVASNGYVGIGITGTPAYLLDVNYLSNYVRFSGTNAYGTSGFKFGSNYAKSFIDPLTNNGSDLGNSYWWSTAHITDVYTVNNVHVSDERFKENIKGLDNSLQTILQLRGVRYDLKPEVFKGKNDSGFMASDIPSAVLKNHIGLLAQEVQIIVPEVVAYDSSREMYGIKYDELIPILIEAIKEQQAKIDNLTALIFSFEATKKSLLESSEITTSDVLISYLAQNAPNPFSESTRIDYYLADNTQKAMINVYDLNGLQLKTISINQTGGGNITINEAELKPGIYIYSLITDGVEVDTKRMILTN